MKRFVYNHGLPFEAKLAENLDDLKRRVEGRKASLLIIDGGVGEGKTTLGVHVADYLQGRPIVFEEQLAMGGADFLVKFRACFTKGHSVILYDEAGDFNRRGALTRFNALLNRTFETFRAFKIVVVLILPNFGVLDQDLFDKQIPRLLIHCYARGEDYGNFSGFSLTRMSYIRDRMRKMVVRSAAYDYEVPNFRGHYLDLKEERSALLDAYSTKGKLKELRGAEVKIEGLVSYSDIAGKVVRSVSWTRQTLALLKLKPKRIIEKKAYFDQGVIDRLADYLDDVSANRDKGDNRRRSPRIV